MGRRKVPKAKPWSLFKEPQTPADMRRLVNKFCAICGRRGITDEEQGIILQAVAAMCYENVWQQDGPFYEKVKPLIDPIPNH